MRKLADAIMRDVVDMTDGARGDWIVRVDGEEHSVGVNEDGPYVDVATAEESEEGDRADRHVPTRPPPRGDRTGRRGAGE